MELRHLSTATALGLLTGSPALAQDVPLLSEIFATHIAQDRREFVEVEATPGEILDGLVILAVDGRAGTAGIADLALDLTGGLVPSTGFFVVGGQNVASVNLVVPDVNFLRNATQTVYLVRTDDVASVLALEGTDVDPDGDLATTIPQMGEVLDRVALVDGNWVQGLDSVFDGATPVGPTGDLLPPGIYRSQAAERAWCTRYLEFDDHDNLDTYARTPGWHNPICPFGESYLVPNAASVEYDEFGHALDLSGSTAIVGARQDEVNGASVGSAYLFDIPSSTQTHKLLAGDGGDGDRFGHSVAIDGHLAIVGAPGHHVAGVPTGAAYVFDVANGQELFELVPHDPDAPKEFGYAVALDGNLALIGAPLDNGVGAVYVFDVTTGAERWKLTATASLLDARLGNAVALDGAIALVGAASSSEVAYMAGAAYLFDIAAGTQIAKLLPQDLEAVERFGLAVALDGPRAVVGTSSHRGFVFDSASGDQQLVFEVPGSRDYYFFRDLDLRGSTVLLGGYPTTSTLEPRIYLHDLETSALTEWVPQGARNGEGFGYRVRFGEKFTLIGAFLERNLHGEHLGSVFALEHGIGQRYCVSTVNSSGAPARIGASGSTSVLANDLVLETVDLPALQTGLHFYGSQTTQVVFGNGFRCVSGLVARLPAAAADAGGVLEQALDNLAPPSPAAMITAGSTWHFQAWFRDPLSGGSLFDLSDALSITFRP